MTRRRGRSVSPRLLIALAALFAFVVALPGCSTRNDSLPALGSEEDYLARRENTTHPYGYAPYDLCAAYDPFCFTPYWSSAPIYYFSRRDGDHDCDGGGAVALSMASVIDWRYVRRMDWALQPWR
jgi:hypothetical protein